MKRGLFWLQWGFFFGVWIWLPWIPSAAAGVLKIETQTSRQVKGDLLNIRVLLTNKGSAPAHQLQVNLDTVGGEEAAPIIPQLDPEQSKTVSFKRDIREVGKGRYPLVVSVDFHDANQYPFTAISGMTFHKGTDVNSQLITESHELTLREKGTWRFHLKNLSTSPRRIEATLYVPKELSTPDQRDVFTLDARAEKELAFEISNFSALPNATYPVFCALEYESDNTHHTAFARTVVRIADNQTLFARFRWLWIALAAVLASALIVVAVRERKSKT